MELFFNKRLVLPFIVLLTAFNVLPVGLLSMYNMDILKVITLVIFFLSLVRFRGYFTKEVRYATLFFLAILLSALNMISKGKYMDWTFFYCLNYLNLFLLLNAFRKSTDIYDYIQVLIGLCVFASFVHAIFYTFPALLEGPLNEIRMGSINLDATKVRIFIPGMAFIAMFLNYYIIKFLYYRKLRPLELLCFFLFFTSIFIFASVRTYFLCVFVSIVVLLLLRKLSFKKMSYLLGGTVVGLLLLSLISSDIYEFVIGRFDIFLKLGDFQLMDVIALDVDYDNEQTFGTVYFRIMEAVYVLQNFSGDMRSILFGNIGTLYDFLGVEQEPAPHISIFGIYYLFGLVGLVTFSFFFVYYTKLIIKNLKRFKNTEHEFLSIVLAIFWFSLFVISFFGGIYYSETALIVTFTIAASLTLKKQMTDELPEN
jgi:hypothetical protein